MGPFCGLIVAHVVLAPRLSCSQSRALISYPWIGWTLCFSLWPILAVVALASSDLS